VTTRSPLTKATLSALPKLKLIAALAVGTDMIDLPTCASQNIVVCNVPAASNEAVAEHAIGLYFALRRNVVALHELTIRGDEWQERKTMAGFAGELPRTCREETIGILGWGDLGT
jgi:lactate dehydrogenase-like 2-hydroxyacid dehydrogenase